MLHSFLNHKFFTLSTMKAFADIKIKVSQKLEFALRSVVNIVGKGQDAGYQHVFFFLFPSTCVCVQKATFSGSLKVRTMW